MTKLTIEKLTRATTDKEGNPLVNKFGKPYGKTSVYANGKWYGCFTADFNHQWNIGDTIEVEVQETKSGDKTYYNIIAPKAGRPDVLPNELLDDLIKYEDETLKKINYLVKKIDELMFLVGSLNNKIKG